MKPALVFPFVIADLVLLKHLQSILPDLKEHFERAYVSTLQTVDFQFGGDDFFVTFPMESAMQVGEHFKSLFQQAAETAHPDQILHICYIDRMAFALQSKYREQFLADIDSLSIANTPLLFQRTQSAWETHPQNYREVESIVTTVGRNLFDRELDYAWCHLAVCAGDLRRIMPLVKNPDMSMIAEVIFYLQETIKTRDVDWLAWEDPFILSRDAVELKHERENSLDEIKKRLRYVTPMIETLTRLSRNGRNS